MAMELTSRWRSAFGATAGAGALLFTFACGGTARELTSVAAAPAVPGAAGAPVLVSCEPHQRTLVRPVVVNGAVVSQVECVAAQAAYAQTAAAPAAAMPVNYGAPYPAPAAGPVYAPLGDAQVVPASYPATAARPVRSRQVVHGEHVERPVKRTRSVKKSAIIIGSSAGVGAGVGA
ncbi:MAG TPA: hypothetical protein VNA28_03070, partial [Solirubrobacteraceae bacterium]|nr:hypothetical protein [Solirubrobacteraceae bacterium]